MATRSPALERFFPAVSWVAVDGDYIIAATALLLEAGLLTTNVRHFRCCPA